MTISDESHGVRVFLKDGRNFFLPLVQPFLLFRVRTSIHPRAVKPLTVWHDNNLDRLSFAALPEQKPFAIFGLDFSGDRPVVDVPVGVLGGKFVNPLLVHATLATVPVFQFGGAGISTINRIQRQR